MDSKTSIKINIGGEGESVSIPVVISGCECRTEDFFNALVKFANDYKKEADSPDIRTSKGIRKPCGCKDAQ